LTVISKLVDSYHRHVALMHCAMAGLAAERYRLANGKWPDALEALAPKFIDSEALVDPFGAGPLRLETRSDGITVSSAGSDRLNDNGLLGLNAFGIPGRKKSSRSDIAFRLWNVDRRGQPARELLPVPPREIR